MQSIAAAKGGKCLSSEYLGQHVKLRWECEKGHQWESIPGNVRRLGSWCDTCARKRKHYPKSQLKLAFPANDIPVQINEAALIPADPIGDTSYK
jgi:hypothetical protein